MKPADQGVSDLGEDSKFSCNECKRRRSRCSRGIPTCLLCEKYKRHCLYERHSKTPLTRKHLTEVEEELSLVKRLLDLYNPDLDVGELLGKMKNGEEIPELFKRRKLNQDPPLNSQGHQAPPQDPPQDPPLPQVLDPVGVEEPLLNEQLDAKPLENEWSSEKSDLQIPQLLPPLLDPHVARRPSDDISPTSTYTWDERKLGDEEPSIIDGMATTESNSYLGAASSAALINLVGGGFFLHPSPTSPLSKPSPTSISPTSISPTAISPTSMAKPALSKPALSKLALKLAPSKPGKFHPTLALALASAVSSYFHTYHISYPIVHKPLFMAQYHHLVPAPPGWTSLLYTIAAIGSFMAAVSPDQNDDLNLFKQAKSFLSIELLETGNLTLVQTLTLMSNYLQKRDRPNSGYNYLGLAVRMALGLGLHRQTVDLESLLDQEIKRRVWWCIYIFDCGQTITYGRPLGIPCAGIDCRLPMNILDTDLGTPTGAPTDGSGGGGPPPRDSPTIYSSVRLQALFHLLTNSIYERIISDPAPTAAQLLAWDQQYLERWKGMVPQYFAEGADVGEPFVLAHAVLGWRYRNLRIIMYRPFLLRRDWDQQDQGQASSQTAGDLCLQECSATIHSMDRFWARKPSHNRMDAWYSLYFLIPAVVMPLVSLRNEPGSVNATSWRHDITTARGIIEQIMPICPPASRILNLIESLGSGFQEESPTTQLMQLHSMLWPSFDIEQWQVPSAWPLGLGPE